MLSHGAAVNNTWGTHEPASVLHECVARNNLEAARFVLANGIDPTLIDHRFRSTPRGWAEHVTKNAEMINLLTAAEQATAQTSP